jgi:hypothetical protein
LKLGAHWNRQFVLAAMHYENAMKLCIRRPFGLNSTLHAIGAKDNIRKAGAFQYFLVHLLVAGIIAAFPANSVHHNLTRRSATAWLKAQGAALDRECSVYRVEATAHGIVHGALCRIDV